MVLLHRLGLLTPDDVRDAVVGELSVMATSPHRALGNTQLAQLTAKDEVARATLMARGALYALSEAATIRARTKDQRGLIDVLVALLGQAETQKQRVLPVSAWVEAIAKDDPDAARAFDDAIVHGKPMALPPNALGPCFRAGTGEYVAFDPGFDLDATRASPDARASGVRPDGPAAKAGLKDGDVVASMLARDGDATVPMKLVVDRGGAKVTLSYVPRSPQGQHNRGQTWSRVKMPDSRCGDLP
jgi:predicted metalloprotease with PDZ domain